jgi:hypothetical protein
MADDEHRPLGAHEQCAEPACVAPRCVVEALAAGERFGPRVVALPGAVRVDRGTLELADGDIVEQRLDRLSEVAADERELRCLLRALEARVDAQVERHVSELDAQLHRLPPPLLRERCGYQRVAVDDVLQIQRRMRVAGQHIEPHKPRLRDLGRKGSA